MNVSLLKAEIGTQARVSRWVTVDQSMIDGFANTTGDRQWIHVDQERARRESPFGTTIAHGFLTLSLVSSLCYEVGAWPVELGTVVNYGLDRLRFLSPVTAGSQIRLKAQLASIEEKESGRSLIRHHCEIEIEGEEKPALVADTIVLLLKDPAAGLAAHSASG